MTTDTATESADMSDDIVPSQTPHHPEQESGDRPTNGSEGVSNIAAHKQATVTDAQDASDMDWDSLSWWQKPAEAVKFAGTYIWILVLFVCLMAMGTADNKKEEERTRREQNQPSLLPGTTSNADAPQLAYASDECPSSGNSTKGLTNVGLGLYRRGYGVLQGYVPQMSYALCLLAIVKFGAPPQQNQQICLARQTEDGFIGNSDIYGLGVRLGIYIQWLCVTFTVKFVPSARRYIVSGYLFFQLGMMVAMCLLFSPGTCTFAAEVAIVLQFLWGGIVIALVPSVNKKTKYNPKSEYLAIDTLTAILGFLIFVFTSWLYVRHWSQGEQDFTATPGDGTVMFWLGPIKPGNKNFFFGAQAFWIAIRTSELFEILQGQPKHFYLSSLLDWSWWFSATMTTGTLVNLLQGFVVAGLYFAHANKTFLQGFKDERLDRGQFGTTVWLFYLTVQGYIDLVAKCWWTTRHLIITLWTFLAIEYTIQENNIEGVRSLNSTGQILPLAMGVATLLSVLYLWVKEFFNRSQKKLDGEATSPLILEQAIGFPTATGRWI